MRIDKNKRNQKRQGYIRKRVIGSSERPRLSLKISGKHMYAQCIDDAVGHTLVFLSTLDSQSKESGIKINVDGAAKFGQLFGAKAIGAGIKEVTFDRNGRRYHGCVKAFADAARQAGLLF